MALRLLAGIVLATVLLAVQGNSGDGGSGSGSERCIEPNPRPEPLGQPQQDAVSEARCHLACIEKISLLEGVSLEVSTRYPAWPMIPDSVLERNCTFNAMVQKCRQGCSQLKHKHCLRICNQEECQADPQNCHICNRDYCLLGCDVKLELKDISNDTHGVPPDPVGPVALTVADGLDDNDFRSTSDAGLYHMDPVNAVPNESSDEVRYPTAIIVRVFKKRTKYIWMTSFEEILNLTSYACVEDVIINLAAINKIGLSHNQFTHTYGITVDVHGENPPTFAAHPDRVRTSIESDTRPGYWKHVIINISWKRPRRGFPLLDYYVVTFKLATTYDQPYCKPENKIVQVNKTFIEDVKLTIKADSLGDGPVSDCHYTVQIESISVYRNIPTPPVDVHDVHVNSSHTIPVPLNLTCNRTWDEKSGKFTYKLDWIMPDDVNVKSAIGSFEVMVDLIGPDGNYETLYTTTYPANMSIYQYIQKVRYDVKNYKHRITMKSKPGDLSLVVLLPAPHITEWPAEAVPPPQVEGVDVQFIVTEAHSSNNLLTLDLVVTWASIDVENTFYQLRLVTQNTTRNDIHHLYFDEASEAQAVISGLKISLNNTGPYLYIQVRAVSRYMAKGNWSEPVSIDLLHLPSPTPGPISTPSPSPRPLSTAVPSPSARPLSTAVPSPSPRPHTQPESVSIDPVNATAVRISWKGSHNLSTLLKYTSYFTATGSLMSRYETVLPPGVNSIDVTLDDAVDGYEHNFTLHYIIPCDDTVAPATFSFDRKYFQIQFGPIDYCLNWGIGKTGDIEAQLQSHFIRIIRERCTDCNKFTTAYLRKGLFYCRDNPTFVSYRSTLINPFPSANSTHLVGIIQSWVSTSPSLTIDGVLVRVSPTCPTHIASLEDGECVHAAQSGSGVDERISQVLSGCAVRGLRQEICNI